MSLTGFCRLGRFDEWPVALLDHKSLSVGILNLDQVRWRSGRKQRFAQSETDFAPEWSRVIPFRKALSTRTPELEKKSGGKSPNGVTALIVLRKRAWREPKIGGNFPGLVLGAG